MCPEAPTPAFICLFYLFYLFAFHGYLFQILFFFGYTACGILVPQPGIKPVPLAVEAPSLNHWTSREFLMIRFRKSSMAKNFEKF